MSVPDKVVEAGSQVVDRIGQNQSQFKGGILADAELHDIAGALRVRFRLGNAVRFRLEEPVSLRMVVTDVQPCTINPLQNLGRWT